MSMEDYNFQKARKNWGDASPLVTPKPWVGLTDEEIAQVVGSPLDEVYLTDFRRVIAKLKERNNG